MTARSEDSRALVRAYAMLALVMVLWAGNAIVGRAVRFDIPPVTLSFGRWLIATVLLLPWSVRSVRRDWPVVRKHWRMLLLLGVLGIAMFNSLLYTGLHHSTAANAMLIQACVPAFVLGFNRVLFGDRAGPMQLLAVILAVLGVAVIVFQGDPARALQLVFGRGDLLLLASAAVWSLYTALLRLRPPVSPISFVALTFATGMTVLAPFAWAEWHAGLRVHWSPAVLGAYAYVALMASLAAYFLFNAAAARTGSQAAGQAVTLLPLFGAALSALILAEPLHLYHLWGMAVILAGIAFGVHAERGKTPSGARSAAPLEDAP